MSHPWTSKQISIYVLICVLLLAVGAITARILTNYAMRDTEKLPDVKMDILIATQEVDCDRGTAADLEAITLLGDTLADELLKKLGSSRPKAFIVIDNFESPEQKKALLVGLGKMINPKLLFGYSLPASKSQENPEPFHIRIQGIAGEDVSVKATLIRQMDLPDLKQEKKYLAAGKDIASHLTKLDDAKMLFIATDASKAQSKLLIDGVRAVLGTKIPVTCSAQVVDPAKPDAVGIYHRGTYYPHSTVGLLISSRRNVEMQAEYFQGKGHNIAVKE